MTSESINLLQAVVRHKHLHTAAVRPLQVVNPDGKPANIPNTNSATVSGLQPLSQNVINPTLIAVRHACQPAASSCSSHIEQAFRHHIFLHSHRMSHQMEN